jgi:hypothetical protein
LVLASEPLIDALARDLRAIAVEMDVKGRYMWLPEDDVAPRVSSTARAILLKPRKARKINMTCLRSNQEELVRRKFQFAPMEGAP